MSAEAYSPAPDQQAKGSEMRDTPWFTHSVVFGWGVQGVWPPGSMVTDIDSVAVSHDEQFCEPSVSSRV